MTLWIALFVLIQTDMHIATMHEPPPHPGGVFEVVDPKIVHVRDTCSMLLKGVDC